MRTLNRLEILLSQFGETALNFFKTNAILILGIFGTSLFAFGYGLTNFSLSMDVELFLAKPAYNYENYMLTGRWGILPFTKLLLPGIQYPFISCFVGLLILSVTLTLMTTQCISKSRFANYLFGSLVISSPIFAHQIEFSFQTAYVLCSVSFMIIGYVLWKKMRGIFMAYFLPCVIYTLSIYTYQSVILVPFACLITEQLCNYTSWNKLIRNFIYISLTIIASLIFGKLIDYLLMYYYSIPDHAYIKNYFYWDKLQFSDIIFILKIYFLGIFDCTIATYSTLPFLLAPIIMLLCSRHFLYNVALILSTFILFIIFPIILGNKMPARLFVFLPILYGGIFYAAYLNSRILFKSLLIPISFFVILISASISTQLFLLDSLGGKRDLLIASRIYNIICDLDKSGSNPLRHAKYTVIAGDLPLYGKGRHFAQRDNDAFGMSIWNAGDEVDGRLAAYLGLLSIDLPHVVSYTYVEDDNIKRIVRRMPAWPDNGCVGYGANCLIIKLSEPAKNQ